MPASPGSAELRRARRRRPCGGDRVLPREAASTSWWSGRRRRWCGGIVDDLTAAGIKAFGPSQARRAARRLQGLHQGLCAEANIPTAAYDRFTRCRSGEGLSRRPGRADRDQGRWARRRQGRGRRRDGGRSRSRDRLMLRRRLRRRRRRGGDRGIPARARKRLLRAVRRRARDRRSPPRRTTSGSFDGDTGPEHRRHGRLFAGAGDDARDDCAQVMEEIIAPTVRAMNARGTPVSRACCSPG